MQMGRECLRDLVFVLGRVRISLRELVFVPDSARISLRDLVFVPDSARISLGDLVFVPCHGHQSSDGSFRLRGGARLVVLGIQRMQRTLH